MGRGPAQSSGAVRQTRTHDGRWRESGLTRDRKGDADGEPGASRGALAPGRRRPTPASPHRRRGRCGSGGAAMEPRNGRIKNGAPPEADEAFRRTGVYHIMAVSGFNVALLASAVFFVLSVPRSRSGRRSPSPGIGDDHTFSRSRLVDLELCAVRVLGEPEVGATDGPA